jgi:biotin/methionine sulfoxide reductase
MVSSPSTSHWGAFSVRVDRDAVVDVSPHPDDPEPSPLLGNLADSVRHHSRVRRPAIRRGWLESGPGPAPGRGHESFVEVGWDEALDAVAAELDRVRREHGNAAVFGGSYGWSSAGRFHHAQSQVHRFLNSIGGYTRSVQNYSYGASQVLLPHVLGNAEQVINLGESWPSLVEHTELLVSFGGLNTKNMSVASGGLTRHESHSHWRDAVQRGMEVVSVSPLRDDLPPDVAGTWYSIIPGTDTAMMLALAHTLVTDGLVDKDFVTRCCTGYAEFEAYLFGRRDSVTKDAGWAAGICGIEAERIVTLARKMAARRTLVNVGWSLQRSEHGEQPLWAGIALAALLGQMGLPGGGFGHGYGSMGDTGAAGPSTPRPSLPRGSNPVKRFIPVARIADMLLRPGAEFDFNGSTHTYPDVRLVYWAGGNPFHHHQDLPRLRRALAMPDTIVVNEPYWTPMAKHADVVFPTTIPLERDDIGGGRRDTHLIAMHRALRPYAQARDDYDIFHGLAQRLGAEDTFTEGRTTHQWLEHLYERWRGRVGGNLPSFSEFWAAGGVRLPFPTHDRTPFAEFRVDPDAHPLTTPSGRIELYSQRIAGFGYADCPGHPAWLEPQEWRDRAHYPLHMIANQPASRLHSQLDMGATSAASKIHGREPIRIHPRDAAERGIADGDVVKVFNSRGACLAGVRLSAALRPGVVQLSTGAWFDPADNEDATVLCVHGNPNVLTADRPTSRLSQSNTGQHCQVQVERHTGPLPDISAFDPPALHPQRQT